MYVYFYSEKAKITAQTLRNKRKRYRNKKKLKTRAHSFQNQRSSEDSVLKKQTIGKIPPGNNVIVNNTSNTALEIENNNDLAEDILSEKPVNIDGITNSAWHYLEPDESETDHCWDKHKEEEEKWQKEMSDNRQKAEDLYGEYIDMDPCFPR